MTDSTKDARMLFAKGEAQSRRRGGCRRRESGRFTSNAEMTTSLCAHIGIASRGESHKRNNRKSASDWVHTSRRSSLRSEP